ncbi:unnamed protein product [Linum tenue]|uniref:Uncharacterized protein n=1 Tax=Linum tenue TaxID=586396 RepID=A0AAV0KQV3_9ROSI|nr:unnamed protein product [Linum tenue]
MNIEVSRCSVGANRSAIGRFRFALAGEFHFPRLPIRSRQVHSLLDLFAPRVSRCHLPFSLSGTFFFRSDKEEGKPERSTGRLGCLADPDGDFGVGVRESECGGAVDEFRSRVALGEALADGGGAAGDEVAAVRCGDCRLGFGLCRGVRNRER